MRIILTPLLVLAIAFAVPSSKAEAKIGKKEILIGGVGIVAILAMIGLIQSANSNMSSIDPNTVSEEECETSVEAPGSEIRRRPSTFESAASYVLPGRESLSVTKQKTSKTGDPLVYWDACNERSKVRGGYFDLQTMGKADNANNRMNTQVRCQGAFVSPKLAEHMDKYLLGCAQQAAKASGVTPPKAIYVNHVGGYVYRNKRRANSLSLHATGNALDVASISFIGDDGKPYQRMSMNRDEYMNPAMPEQKAFYNAFSACWSKNQNCPGGTKRGALPGGVKGCVGSHGPQDSDHNNHMHLEYTCAN